MSLLHKFILYVLLDLDSAVYSNGPMNTDVAEAILIGDIITDFRLQKIDENELNSNKK